MIKPVTKLVQKRRHKIEKAWCSQYTFYTSAVMQQANPKSGFSLLVDDCNAINISLKLLGFFCGSRNVKLLFLFEFLGKLFDVIGTFKKVDSRRIVSVSDVVRTS